MRLVRMQLFRWIKRPWSLLFLAVIICIYVGLSIAPLRNITSYSAFMGRYDGMDPKNVAIAVLGEPRDDLSLVEIFEEFMASKGDWLYLRSFVNSSSGVTWISVLMASFFLCRDLNEDSVRPMLLAGYRRGSVFAWLVVRYYFYGIIINVIAIMMVCLAWDIDLSTYPHAYVFSTQFRYLLYSLSLFSYSMLIAFLLKNPVLSALVSFVFLLIMTRVRNLFPSFSPMSVISKEEHWMMTTGPDVYMSYVIASIVIIVVCIAISYFVFRRRDA